MIFSRYLYACQNRAFYCNLTATREYAVARMDHSDLLPLYVAVNSYSNPHIYGMDLIYSPRANS